jgi:CHAT domain-containing protein/Tfp pilus assembly protein PilF
MAMTRAAIALALLFPGIALAQRPLSLDDEPNREEIFSRGQTWPYEIALRANEFARLSVEPQLPRVEVTLSAPDGTVIARRPRTQYHAFAETFSVIAEKDGTYRLDVASQWPQRDRCVIRVVERRPARASDRDRIEAEKMVAEANVLQDSKSQEKVMQAAALFERAMHVFHQIGDPGAEADAEERMAVVAGYYLGDVRKAMRGLLGSLAIRQCIGDDAGIGESLDDLGSAFRAVGFLRRALLYLRAALPYRETERDAIVTLHNIADTQADLGLDEALPTYLRTLEMLRDHGEPIGLGFTHHSLAAYYFNRSDWQNALQHGEKALRFFRIAKYDRGTLAALLVIGQTYSGEGEPERALEYLRNAQRLSDAMPAARQNLATLMQTTGAVYLDLRQYDRAIEHFEKALTIFHAIEDPIHESEVLINLGQSYAAMGKPEKALEYFARAAPVIESVEYHGLEGERLGALAKAQLLLGKTQEANDSASRAIEILHANALVGEEAEAHLTRARLERMNGDLEAARKDAESAVTIFETIRGRIGPPEKRASFMASVWEAYEAYIDILMESHLDAEALHASERARARSLVELLAEARGGAVRRAEPARMRQIRSLRERISSKAQAQLFQESSGNVMLGEQLKGELDDLYTQYEKLVAEVRRDDPALAAVTSPQPLDLARIQREVVDDSSVLLEYALGEKRSFLWVVTQSEIHSYELPPRARIESAVRSAYRALSTSAGGGGETLRSLSRMILEPASAALGSKRLIIVPDGALQYLPFAALPSSGSRRPMIADHEIVILPSASAISVLRRYPHSQPASRTLAVFADPVFDKNDSRLSAHAARSEPAIPADTDLERSARESGLRYLSRLPFTRREATAILSLVEPSLRKGALDFAANRRAVMDPDLADYRFVHFATHGLLNNFHPELSGIVLSMVDASGRSQEGFLSTADVFNLSWNTDLVVLSGCRTGLGKEVRGEGIAGLTQAFMYAGAPRVVASLWNVNDAATAALMKKFYQEMLGPNHLAPPAALRAAQMSLQKTKRWSAPYYWAGFVMQGEWR